MSNFNKYVDDLCNALGLENEKKEKLLEILEIFTDKDKYKLIEQTEDQVEKILLVNQEIKNLKIGTLAPYIENITTNWDLMNENLVQLQFLSSIQRKGDNCDQVINELLSVLNKKISTINEILKKNLGETSSNSSTNTNPQVKQIIKVADETKSSAEQVVLKETSNPIKSPVSKLKAAVGTVKIVNKLATNPPTTNPTTNPPPTNPPTTNPPTTNPPTNPPTTNPPAAKQVISSKDAQIPAKPPVNKLKAAVGTVKIANKLAANPSTANPSTAKPVPSTANPSTTNSSTAKPVPSTAKPVPSTAKPVPSTAKPVPSTANLSTANPSAAKPALSAAKATTISKLGGADDIYMYKYLKYKNKYLSLKNNINF